MKDQQGQETVETLSNVSNSSVESAEPGLIMKEDAPTDASPTDADSQQAELDESVSTNRKKVKFTNIEIREYPICVGNNPAGTLGVPITIDWTHDGELTCPLDMYEENKPTPRTMAELRIPSKRRDEMLKQLGFSAREIMEGKRNATIGRNQRKKTNNTFNLAPYQEFLEMSIRATKNATIRRGAKKKERELLATFGLKDSKAFKTVQRTTTLETVAEYTLKPVPILK